jgi:hypothetical protein
MLAMPCWRLLDYTEARPQTCARRAAGLHLF